MREEFGITFDKKAKTSKQLGKAIANENSIEEEKKAEQFLDSITKEKQIEGENHNDKSGN